MSLLSLEEVGVIAVGGAIGSVSRFGLSSVIQRLFPYPDLPWGIIFCNVLGSFLIGVLFRLFEAHYIVNPLWRTGLVIGLLGGFTTFSSFSLDSIYLLQTGAYFAAMSNIVISVIGCLMATLFGIWCVTVFV